MDALNVVYEEKEKRGFIKLNLVSLAFTFAAILSVLLALGAVVVLPVALSYLGLQNLTGLLFRLARWPLLLLVVIFGLAVADKVALLYSGMPRNDATYGSLGAGKASELKTTGPASSSAASRAD